MVVHVIIGYVVYLRVFLYELCIERFDRWMRLNAGCVSIAKCDIKGPSLFVRKAPVWEPDGVIATHHAALCPTSAISGGAQLARRLLIETFESRLQFLQAA